MDCPMIDNAYTALAEYVYTKGELDEYYSYNMKANEIAAHVADSKAEGIVLDWKMVNERQ